MTAETRHPLAGTYQTCRVCDGTYLVLADGTLDAHHPGRDTSVNCDGAAETLPIPVTEQTPIQNFLDEFPELANTPVRFWTCPIREHRRPREPVVTVEWIDGIAHCTAPGCTNTSAPARSRLSEFTEETSKLADSAAATAELALPKLAELIGGAPSTPDTDLRDRIAAVLAEQIPGYDVSNAFILQLLMALVQPELDRRDEQTAKVDRFVHQISDALGIEPTTDLGELGEQVQAQVAWLKREFVTSNNTNADWVEHDLRQREKLDRLAAENAELRTYTETTRYHQQRHADAVRELEKLRAEQGAPVVDLADQMRAARELNELRRIAESVRNALDQPRPALRDRHGRVWQPAPNDLYTLGPSGLPGHRCEIAWERTYVEREFGELTEVPAERGEAT